MGSGGHPEFPPLLLPELALLPPPPALQNQVPGLSQVHVVPSFAKGQTRPTA
jgi:hypothetical protein